MSAREFKTQKTPSKARFYFLFTVKPNTAVLSILKSTHVWILHWKTVLSAIQNLLPNKMSRKQTLSLQYFQITDHYSVPINNPKLLISLALNVIHWLNTTCTKWSRI